MTATPTPGAVALTAAAARRVASLGDLTRRAAPGCPTCGGQGWTTRRVEGGFAGTEARACHCTEIRAND